MRISIKRNCTNAYTHSNILCILDCVFLKSRKVFDIALYRRRIKKLEYSSGVMEDFVSGLKVLNWERAENICGWRLLPLEESNNWGPSGLEFGTTAISCADDLPEESETCENIFARNTRLIKEIQSITEWNMLW